MGVEVLASLKYNEMVTKFFRGEILDFRARQGRQVKRFET